MRISYNYARLIYAWTCSSKSMITKCKPISNCTALWILANCGVYSHTDSNVYMQLTCKSYTSVLSYSQQSYTQAFLQCFKLSIVPKLKYKLKPAMQYKLESQCRCWFPVVRGYFIWYWGRRWRVVWWWFLCLLTLSHSRLGISWEDIITW